MFTLVRLHRLCGLREPRGPRAAENVKMGETFEEQLTALKAAKEAGDITVLEFSMALKELRNNHDAAEANREPEEAAAAEAHGAPDAGGIEVEVGGRSHSAPTSDSRAYFDPRWGPATRACGGHPSDVHPSAVFRVLRALPPALSLRASFSLTPLRDLPAAVAGALADKASEAGHR